MPPAIKIDTRYAHGFTVLPPHLGSSFNQHYDVDFLFVGSNRARHV